MIAELVRHSVAEEMWMYGPEGPSRTATGVVDHEIEEHAEASG
ncbi:MAG TPA: hypothetical protein VGJ95_11345 [Pseudonocardiaceae bacterium]